MANSHNHRSAADLLWSAMLVRPDFASGSQSMMRIWREGIYPKIVLNQVARAQEHESPEPWLTLNVLLQAMSGHGFHRSKLRFLGVVGGAETQREYEAVAAGGFVSPLLLVGGFPRSGTTSLQAVVRSRFRAHIVESDTPVDRFSLWDYPKHEVDIFRKLKELHAPDIRILISIRKFEDALASLAVGRGSVDAVKIDLKIKRWLAWMELSRSSDVITVPFEYLAQNSPRVFARSLGKLLAIAPTAESVEADSYESMIRASGKGDVSSLRQSNIPQVTRNEELRFARDAIIERVGMTGIEELNSVYETVASDAMSVLENP